MAMLPLMAHGFIRGFNACLISFTSVDRFVGEFLSEVLGVLGEFI